MATTLIKDFLRVDNTSGEYVLNRANYISKKFDEPTYLSFKVDFGTDDQIFHKDTYVKNYLDNTNYDLMPHPLFVEQDQPISSRNVYSTISYLRDCNEFVRAEMLEEFIQGIKTIQNNYGYYFQQISGVDSLIEVKPERGRRVANDAKITLTCLEGLDLRMTYLLNLYKKIAWDDTYQRWILPDMMRWFSFNIYITEFRTFQKPSQFSRILDNKSYGGGINQTIANVSNLSNNITAQIQSQPSSINKEVNLVLDVIDYIMPTWVISCEQCEIDITSIKNNSLSNLTVANLPEMSNVSFDIKIGNIKEIQSYPMRKRLLDDVMLNISKYKTIDPSSDSDYIVDSNYSSNRRYKDIELVVNQINDSDRSHISTEPYYLTGTNNLINLASNYKDLLDTNYGTTSVNNNSERTGWLERVADNAIKTGMGIVTDRIETAIDTALTSPIKILGGTSISQLVSAIQSANVVSMYNVIKRSVEGQVNDMNVSPSALLNEQIVYDVYTKALESIANSSATTEEGKSIINASRELLSNAELFYATLNDIPNKNAFKDDVNKTIGSDRSIATELDGGPNKIQNGYI